MANLFRRPRPLERATTPLDVGTLARSAGVTEVPTNLGPARPAPSLPGALNPEAGAQIQLPGVNYPPAGAIPQDDSGDANIAPGASATLVTLVVPGIMRHRMVGIGFGAVDDVALGFLTWRIEVNGAPAPSYFGQTAAIGSIRQLADIFLLTGNSATIAVIGTMSAVAVATYRVIARVRGWYFTEKEAR
jgi:hypothetical protein